MRTNQVSDSHLDTIVGMRNQINELTKSVGRGSTALRDPTGTTSLSMATAGVPTLVSQEQRAGVKFANGTVLATDGQGSDLADFSANQVHADQGLNVSTGGVSVGAGGLRVNSDGAVVNGGALIVGQTTTRGTHYAQGFSYLEGDLHVTGSILCDGDVNVTHHGQFGALDSYSGIGTPANINAGSVHSTFYGIINPPVQGPVGPVGPPGPEGPPGPPGPPSERRLKHHLGELGDSLGVLGQVKTGRFTFKHPDVVPGADRREHDGLYVDEIVDAAPNAVIHGDDGLRYPDDRALIAHLINAVQQLTKDRDALAARLDALEGAA